MFNVTNAERINDETGSNQFRYVSSLGAENIVLAYGELSYGAPVFIEKTVPIYNLDETLFGYEVTYGNDLYSDTMIIMDTNIEKLLVYSFTMRTPRAENKVVSEFLATNSRNAETEEKKYLTENFQTALEITKDKLKTHTNEIIEKCKIVFNINVFLPKASNPVIDESLVNSDFRNLDEWFDSHTSYSENKKCLSGAEDMLFQLGATFTSQEVKDNCGQTAALNVLEYFENKGYGVFGGKYAGQIYKDFRSLYGYEKCEHYLPNGGRNKKVRGNKYEI